MAGVPSAPDSGGGLEGSKATPPLSFAQVLGAIKAKDHDMQPTDHTGFRREGNPAISFSSTDMERGHNLIMKHVIVLKFSSIRPSLEAIRDSINRTWRVFGEFALGLLDPRHVLVRLDSEEEVQKALSRDSFHIRGVRFKAFRWHTGFSLTMDPILASIWVKLPGLPFKFFHPMLLKAIGDTIGTFLRIDENT